MIQLKAQRKHSNELRLKTVLDVSNLMKTNMCVFKHIHTHTVILFLGLYFNLTKVEFLDAVSILGDGRNQSH